MSLKNLQEITSLVTKMSKLSRFSGVTSEAESGSKYLQLINGLEAKSWSDDDHAVAELYGNEVGSKTFDMLKSRAKEQLVNMIFQLDTEKAFKSSYDKAYYLTCKNVMSGAVLFVQGRLNSGEEQLKLAIKNARHYQFSDLLIIALRLMRNITSFAGPKSKFDKYNSELKYQMKVLEAELLAEELFQELALISTMSAGNKDDLTLRAKNSFEILKKLLADYDTYSIRISYYRVGLMFYNNAGSFSNSISLALLAEQYFNDHPQFYRKIRLGEMSLNKLYGALHLRDYISGSQFAEECKDYFNPGSVNWIIFLEYYFLLCLHTKQYLQAIEIYNQVISHSGFKSFPPRNIEKWKIFEAFLVYVAEEPNAAIKKFNIPKFINEVPLFSKDKAGYNLSIIIAQVILSLKVGDYESIVGKSEALKLYASRYIKKEKNPRSYYFIKMLQVMIKYDFDGIKTEQIANKFFMKLKEANIGEQSELESLEVIPYDILWPELINKLKENSPES